ncbi:hypothetical protein DWF00_16520 [Bosea caraganae]|uniref:Uncharacterized protein n=1 Tax=Bosea caraganae TaxID=2763117 RepID=A0A370KYQ7_9HYPH|nr:hypothetical protein [Bosea caraganae]RDJ20115.1 hypothetical protein DWE98_26125 [Bosea caraganae]RDJ24827.1 hypothetical protein DWF00_16520 [Bosea caraganae]
MASLHRLMPPASLKLRTRLADIRCGFCGCREEPDETGRILTISHPKAAICELCMDEADLMAACAGLARQPAKARPGKRRLLNRHSVGA